MAKDFCSGNCPTWYPVICVQMICYWDEFGYFLCVKALKVLEKNQEHPPESKPKPKKQEKEKEAVIRITGDEPFWLRQFTEGSQTVNRVALTVVNWGPFILSWQWGLLTQFYWYFSMEQELITSYQSLTWLVSANLAAALGFPRKNFTGILRFC